MTFLRKIYVNKTIRYAYIGWFVIALFFFYQYILRVSPGVLIDDIRNAFKITAEEFSTLGFYYLLAYALMQIPLGILLDRYGVKKIAFLSILLCIFGTYIFAKTTDFTMLKVSRFIIGFGSASALMSALKFISDHIAPGGRGFLMGASLAIGPIGGLLAAKLVGYLDASFDWRALIMIGVYLGIGMIFLISVVLKNTKSINLSHDSTHDVFVTIKEIVTNPCIILYAILAIGLYTPLAAIADLWGPAFIMKKFALSKAEAAQFAMIIYVGLTFGSLLMPWYCEMKKIINIVIVISTAVLVASIWVFIYLDFDNIYILAAILFIIGFFGGAEMMCFTGALANSTPQNSGQIIGVVNTFNMLSGAFLQWLIGYFLDLGWKGEYNSFGVRDYSLLEYQNSMLTLLSVLVFCLIFSLLLLSRNFKHKI